MDYQNTLNLPKTDFPMKASLNQREPEQIKKWETDKTYELIQEKNKSKPIFAMPDGPPYANGNIHVGHCLNKILKDFAIKYRAISGNRAVFIPGWDCHGLPIEHAVSKELGPKRREMNDGEIREKCRSYATKYINQQREQFKRLGILADWYRPYTTMDSSYEAAMVKSLAKIYENGFIYRGEKPVHWCWSCGTALAEAEVEYENRKDPSIYVKFEIDQNSSEIPTTLKDEFKNSKVFFVIWTTTPWTLPANLAVSVHKDFDYGLYETGSEKWIIATELKEAFEKDTNKTLKLIKKFKGKDLEKLKYSHPFVKRTGVTLLGNHVTLDAGTGIVHTAPGHGAEDYTVCMQYGIKPFNPVDGWGKYTDLYADMKGVKVFDANPKVIELLKNSNHLIAVHDLDHSFPHCWRCHNPVIFRATSQWFISMDNNPKGDSLRKRALREIKNVKWIPSWGENRITAMVENRPDWCISRQRLWGVPIPVFYCDGCGKDYTSSELMQKVSQKIEKEGLEAWHKSEITDYENDPKCKNCGKTKFTKGKDILDVWFDSGVCHEAVQANHKAYPGLQNPADLYLEGSDQHRGWFQSSLMTSVAMNNFAPFKTVITHGFVNDGQGRKMSKSLGNVLDPLKFIEKSGAEILRLWVAYVDYSDDVQAGQESFDRVTECYRRVRNTCRYILGNLYDFNPEKDAVGYEKLLEIDKWALTKLYDFIDLCKDSYEKYEYHKIYQALQNYCTVELSAIYLDVLKDRLYTFKASGLERRAAQTVIYEIIKNLMFTLSPILTFLSEEVYAQMPGKKEKSIFLCDFPKLPAQWNNLELKKEWEEVLKVRSVVQKKLEEARQAKLIGSSLEAKIKLELSSSDYDLIKKREADLCSLFIVSQVEFSKGKNTLAEVLKAEGEKCVRCWNFSTDIKEVCPKCRKALSV
ncbi:MAG: isoleucine--tRNA ligase [Oligoflexia bacterium]|nr:isoleucine--tRNA ligase [Oligoflexia bacterium]